MIRFDFRAKFWLEFVYKSDVFVHSTNENRLVLLQSADKTQQFQYRCFECWCFRLIQKHCAKRRILSRILFLRTCFWMKWRLSIQDGCSNDCKCYQTASNSKTFWGFFFFTANEIGICDTSVQKFIGESVMICEL